MTDKSKGCLITSCKPADAVRFNDFIDGVAEHSPKHKESLMTIAERLRQEGFQKGIRAIAKTMLDAGVPLEDVLRFTSLTVEDLAEINHQ